jgi:hypothetical protein
LVLYRFIIEKQESAMKIGMKALLAATALMIGNAAHAGTFTYGSFSVNGVGVDIQQPIQRSVIAGEITLIGAGVNSGQTLDVWCLDLLNSLQVGPYTYQISPLTTAGAGGLNPPLTQTQITEIGDLMFDGLSALDKVAIQLAIWSVEYPGFQTLGVDAGTLSDEAIDLASVTGSPFAVDINLLHDAPVQPNQALAFAVTPVPLPGAMWLFVTGLAGLIGIGRVKKFTA